MTTTPTTTNDPGAMSERELALWMLQEMRESEAFLDMLRAARRRGKPDVLDAEDLIEQNTSRLAKLYKNSDEEEPAEVPAALAGAIEEIMRRDLLSSREEFLEKAMRAYLDAHPRGSEGLPANWATTFEAAKDEIEGRTQGAFEPGFVASLAAAAREEIEKQAAQNRERSGRDRRV